MADLVSVELCTKVSLVTTKTEDEGRNQLEGITIPFQILAAAASKNKRGTRIWPGLDKP